jgi:hypothetical protein
MKRYGSVIGLRAEKVAEYKKLHAAVWPEVSRMIAKCHIQNYSIYLRQLDDGQHYLCSAISNTPARLCRRYGENGGGLDDPEMVGGLQTLPETVVKSCAR